MATINNIGIPGLSPGILQPKQKHKWRVTFSNMGGGNDSQPVSIQATTVTRPKMNFEEVELHRYNSRVWVAGKYMFDPLTITWEDDIKNGAARVIREQIQKQQWTIGTEGQFLASAPEASIYKFATVLDMLDGNDAVLERWTCEGCFIQNVDWGDVDYASSEAILVTMTLRYDLARQDFETIPSNGVAIGGPG